MKEWIIPADVPPEHKELFRENSTIISQGTDHLFLFSCDQKIEHLHDDFNPDDDDIPDETIDPEHFFKIGAQGRIGALATQLELIARYGPDYPTIPYLAKLNSKTPLVPPEQKDPMSVPLWSIADVVSLREDSNLLLCGVGMTVYLGSEYEDAMMQFAAQSIFEAHQEGLIAIVWMYPRGKAIEDDTDPHLLAGAAGAANALGADVVKIKPPHATQDKTSIQALVDIVAAAGNTKVLCSGGSKQAVHPYLQQLSDQIHHGGVAGTATGRNIFQRSLPEAVALTHAIAAIIYDDAAVSDL